MCSSVTIEVGTVERTETCTRMTVFVTRKTDYYTTEYNTYRLELVTNAQRVHYTYQHSKGNTLQNSCVTGVSWLGGTGLGVLLGNTIPASLTGAGIVSLIILVCQNAEIELNNELIELCDELEYADSTSGIAYVERTYYRHTEGLGSTSLADERYYTEWNGCSYYSLII